MSTLPTLQWHLHLTFTSLQTTGRPHYGSHSVHMSVCLVSAPNSGLSKKISGKPKIDGKVARFTSNRFRSKVKVTN